MYVREYPTRLLSNLGDERVVTESGSKSLELAPHLKN